jgi:hypothetical protein
MQLVVKGGFTQVDMRTSFMRERLREHVEGDRFKNLHVN